MVRLVTQIMDSRYAVGLFAWTSMHDLCIVQTEMEYPPYPTTYLRIRPVEEDGRFLEFRYLDTGPAEQQWHRVVEREHGFQQLEQFLKHLHWFPPVS
jgi:hypothetical protein